MYQYAMRTHRNPCYPYNRLQHTKNVRGSKIEMEGANERESEGASEWEREGI